MKENQSDYSAVVAKALDQTQQLFAKEDQVDYNEIHAVKSILYAAIETVGMKADQLFSLQRRLRELFVLVTTKPNAQT